MRRYMVTIFILLATGGFGEVAFSQETGTVDKNSENPQQTTQKHEKKSRNHKTNSKDAEGTKALNRFNTDPIVKSQYKLNGQPLEVDTD